MKGSDPSDWSEYKRLVLNKLDQNCGKLDDLQKAVSDMKVEIGGLKVRAGVWVAAAGGIPALVIVALKFWG